MLDRQKIRDEISDAARERWNQLNEVGMQGIVAAECADIAMRILDAHGAFEQPQGEQDAKPGPYRLRDLTDDEVRELRARYETSEAARAEQPQDDGDVRAPRCPECGATSPNWRPDDVECEICAADLEDTIDDLAEKVEQKQADPDIRYLTQATKMIAAHVRELAAENARLRAALEARDAKVGGSNG